MFHLNPNLINFLFIKFKQIIKLYIINMIRLIRVVEIILVSICTFNYIYY